MNPSTSHRRSTHDSVIRWPQILVYGALALLAACGGQDTTEAGSRLAVTLDPEVAELLGTPVTEEDVQAEFESIHSRIEELTAQCMARSGFDYMPVPFEIAGAQPVEDTETSLGVTDQFFGFYRADFEPPPLNPNDSMLESLTEEERTLYNRALQGGPLFDLRLDTEETIRENLAAQATDRGGCQFESQTQALAETDRNQVLIDAYSELRLGMVQTDQRLIRARVEWATCMAEAGFAYRDDAAMRGDLSEQAFELLEALNAQGIRLEPLQDPPAEAVELINALRATEVEVAGANAECRGPFDEALRSVRADVDALFLDRNS